MKSFLYLATPYTLFPDGIHQAWILACQTAAEFCREGIPVYSPIAAMHPVAMHGNLDPLSHAIWIPLNEAMMAHAAGLIVLCAEGWDKSIGVKAEIQEFTAMRKPIFYTGGTWPVHPGVVVQMQTLCMSGVKQ